MKLSTLLFVISINFVLTCRAQLLDSVALAIAPEYTDLEEALKEPENVIKLSL